MNAERAVEELKLIRQLMERPVRYSTMSGLSGILAGAAALAGVACDWQISAGYADNPHRAFWLNLVVWAGVFVTAFLAATVLTRLRELRQGMPFWSPAKRKVLGTILPPFVAGAGLTVAVAGRWYLGAGSGEWGLIPAIWMCFYGLACWQVGTFSIVEIRVLGAAFVLAGILSAAFGQGHPYWALGLTFGAFHMIYGVVVWIRHGG